MYAQLVKTSKYYSSQHTSTPFKVSLSETSDHYCWKGNGNRYRTEDLDFFICKDGNYYPHGILNLDFPLADRCFKSVIEYMHQDLNSKSLSDQDHIYRFNEYDAVKTAKELIKLLPKKQPTCHECGRIITFCYCE